MDTRPIGSSRRAAVRRCGHAAGKVRQVGQGQGNLRFDGDLVHGCHRVQPFADHQRSAPGTGDLARAAQSVAVEGDAGHAAAAAALARDPARRDPGDPAVLLPAGGRRGGDLACPRWRRRWARAGGRFLDWIATANNFALQPDGAEASTAEPDIMRVAFKLATGAGKTTVMAMLIAWQALNAFRMPNSRRFSRGLPDRHAGHHDPGPAAGAPAERSGQLLRAAEPRAA